MAAPLLDLVVDLTGYDATDPADPVFAVSETEPCSDCGAVETTALLDFCDANGDSRPERLCCGCTEARL